MKTTIILSGGADSSTLAYYLKNRGDDLFAVVYNYGQKHKKEIDCAWKIMNELDIPGLEIDLSFLGKELDSALTNDEEIPEGHYEAKNMKKTIVLNRNLIMASMAHAIGYSRGFKNIALGIHGGDHVIYFDCRPEFINSLETTLQLSTGDENIEVIAPFLFKDKTEIIKKGVELGVPYAKTWTCYNGREKACGKCGSCHERLESFEKLNLTDPLEYA